MHLDDARTHTPQAVDGLEGFRGSHFVHFYEDARKLTASVATFVRAGIDSGGAGLVIAREAYRDAIRTRLAGDGLPVARLAEDGRYHELDATDVLGQILVDDTPDAKRFHDVVAPVLARASDEGRRPDVRVFGELVALLLAQGKPEAALRVERLWNVVCARTPLSLFCAYPSRDVDGQQGHPALASQICDEHRHVLPSDPYLDLAAESGLQLAGQLQRTTLALEAETTRRKELEDLLYRRERELTDVLEQMQDGVVDVMPEGTILWANPSFRSMVTGDGGPMRDARLSDVVQDAHVAERLWASVVRGETPSLSFETRGSDGVPRRLRLHTATLRVGKPGAHMRLFVRAS
jgi:PAS domain-containing protein